MFRFYSPILLLQIFCIYHAYKNNADQKWFWFIIFFPLIGSLIYLYDTFLSHQNIDDISEGIKSTFVSNYKIDQLEKQLNHSDTIANKRALADEYSIAGNNQKAFELYESCLDGLHENDPAILKKLSYFAYVNQDYQKAIDFGSQIISDPIFKQSEERISLAWSYYHLEMLYEAEKNFQAMDLRFSNYNHRLEYAKFLNLTHHYEASKAKCNELLDEIESMDRHERKAKRGIEKEILKFYHQL